MRVRFMAEVVFEVDLPVDSVWDANKYVHCQDGKCMDGVELKVFQYEPYLAYPTKVEDDCGNVDDVDGDPKFCVPIKE